ncbi:MAG TPA: NUDIX domain-containing protein, partial [Stellaceae bacterium]
MTVPGTEPTSAGPDSLEARRAARRYPDRPIVAVLAVVLRGDGPATRALIVQRAQQPNAGRWGFPGGVLELGETIAEGAMRELAEETGVVAEPAGWLNVHDAVSRDSDGR